MLEFDLPKEQSSIIKVIGIGGGGSNAVNYMFNQGIRGVNFVIGNTDEQALELSPIPNKIQLGPASTRGLGAGSNPDIGRLATEESLEEIRALLEKNTRMVFVTAGMGGGTGTGGAPVVAELARSMGILTVGIVTSPFFFEGRRKIKQAEAGIEEMRNAVDSLIVISNDNIREQYGNLTRSDAFAHADDILAIAARSISEIITVPGQINVDFADVEYVMKNSGVAIMGSATAEGEGRAAKAIQAALASPLLNDNDIRGAQKVLLNITSGTDQMRIDEITEIHEYVLEAVGADTDVIFGTCDDDSLGDKICVTIIATGFNKNGIMGSWETANRERVVHDLGRSTPVAPKVEVTPPVVPFTEEPVKPEVNNDMFVFRRDEVVVEDTIVEDIKEVDESNAITFSFDLNKEEENTFEVVTTEEESLKEAEEDNFFFAQEETEMEATSEQLVEEDPTLNFSVRKVEEKAAEELGFVFRQREVEQPKATAVKEDDLLNERLRRLRNLNMKLNNPNSLNELEAEPAFKRRNIQLTNTPYSSESDYSRYSLSEGDENRGEIRKNNSFLHGNVD
jgi:cell division protein FtsZ